MTHSDWTTIWITSELPERLWTERYLVELEKVHELFPESAEVIWQLARRYHLVEKMPATASSLVPKINPNGS